jgi:hypothetical protein
MERFKECEDMAKDLQHRLLQNGNTKYIDNVTDLVDEFKHSIRVYKSVLGDVDCFKKSLDSFKKGQELTDSSRVGSDGESESSDGPQPNAKGKKSKATKAKAKPKAMKAMKGMKK